MKKIPLLLLTLMLAFSFLLCFAETAEETDAPYLSLSCAEAAEALRLDRPLMTESLYQITEKKALRLLELEYGQYTDLAVVMDATRVTAEAIILVDAANAEYVPVIADMLEQYRLSLLSQYKTYRPEEVPKLENAVVVISGLRIMLIIEPV